MDQPGNGLDIGVTARRDKQAAQRFFRQVLKRCRYVPRVMITAKLASYSAAKRAIVPGVEHRQHKGLNHRAGNSPQPTRQRERPLRRFKSAGQAQRFLSTFEPMAGHCRLCRPRVPAADYRATRMQRFVRWRAVTGALLGA